MSTVQCKFDRNSNGEIKKSAHWQYNNRKMAKLFGTMEIIKNLGVLTSYNNDKIGMELSRLKNVQVGIFIVSLPDVQVLLLVSFPSTLLWQRFSCALHVIYATV